MSTDSLRKRFASEVMNAQVDIYTGCVMPDDFEGRLPLSADWIDYVRSQMDGELLDTLHEKWLHAKGMHSVLNFTNDHSPIARTRSLLPLLEVPPRALADSL